MSPPDPHTYEADAEGAEDLPLWRRPTTMLAVVGALASLTTGHSAVQALDAREYVEVAGQARPGPAGPGAGGGEDGGDAAQVAAAGDAGEVDASAQEDLDEAGAPPAEGAAEEPRAKPAPAGTGQASGFVTSEPLPPLAPPPPPPEEDPADTPAGPLDREPPTPIAPPEDAPPTPRFNVGAAFNTSDKPRYVVALLTSTEVVVPSFDPTPLSAAGKPVALTSGNEVEQKVREAIEAGFEDASLLRTGDFPKPGENPEGTFPNLFPGLLIAITGSYATREEAEQAAKRAETQELKPEGVVEVLPPGATYAGQDVRTVRGTDTDRPAEPFELR